MSYRLILEPTRPGVRPPWALLTRVAAAFGWSLILDGDATAITPVDDELEELPRPGRHVEPVETADLRPDEAALAAVTAEFEFVVNAADLLAAAAVELASRVDHRRGLKLVPRIP